MIYGCMDDKEIAALFTGYGYQMRIVEDLNDIDSDLGNSLEWAFSETRRIQKAARSSKSIKRPRCLVIAMRTPKGRGGPKKVDGEFTEGSFHSHQQRPKAILNILKTCSRDWRATSPRSSTVRMDP